MDLYFIIGLFIFFIFNNTFSFVSRIILAVVLPPVIFFIGVFLKDIIPIFWYKYYFYIISFIVIMVFIALVYLAYKIKPKTKKIKDDDIPTLGADINDFFEQDKQEQIKKKKIDDLFKKLDDL